MANRFRSIVDGISASALEEVLALRPSTNVHWYIKDGKLRGQVGKLDEEFIFEKGDPDSDAIVLLLNNLPRILQSFKEANNEARIGNRPGTTVRADRTRGALDGGGPAGIGEGSRPRKRKPRDNRTA